MENDFIKDLQKWNEESQKNADQLIGKNADKIFQKDIEYLTERLNVRLTKSELIMLKEKSSLTGQSIANLIRTAIKGVQNIKILIPSVEENKVLLEYRTNFSRIRNHFSSQLWNNVEREMYKKLLDEVIRKIDKYLQK